ncbi:Esterase [[Actinomadura] parvosata subsp. kistnae]|uniref:Esterase n=1 Tax=[Actinomadura] parvosata subsp. kistnae TaxID=1909395 RepID=A0A1U9ZSZ2_9ACTN|nr:alpha/beta hydrolase [Nonomuraea sp. ATCC 55076]AQZ61051.1 esterase [Nonomuraea sp. ATCC 55076]SPL87586.1 Esterase [Actinomadura parvosata subsp. kistnae]
MSDLIDRSTGFPAPPTVSEQARQWLAMRVTRAPYPPAGDTAAWLALAEQTNAYIVQRLTAMPVSASAEARTMAGVTVWVAGEDEEGPLYLDFHGGALLFGGGEAARANTAVTATTVGMATWGVDYRMPPLHPYPAALDDAVAVYRAALERREPRDLYVGGASAGGNIAAALLLRARDEGLPMPAALLLNSPEVDLTESGDSFRTNAGVDTFLGSLKEANELYAAGADLAHPYLSPLFGDLSGFPPTYLQTGTRDLFLSNAVLMHRKLRLAGVEAELHVGEAMPHGGLGGAPEDRELLAEQRRFLDKHAGR